MDTSCVPPVLVEGKKNQHFERVGVHALPQVRVHELGLRNKRSGSLDPHQRHVHGSTRLVRLLEGRRQKRPVGLRWGGITSRVLKRSECHLLTRAQSRTQNDLNNHCLELRIVDHRCIRDYLRETKSNARRAPTKVSVESCRALVTSLTPPTFTSRS